MKIVAVIPARGGSKGIPRKNIKLLKGNPLIAYAILNALKSKWISDVIVSTDDEEIATVAQNYGSRVVLRPEELATDEITLDPVINHAVRVIESEGEDIDVVITMQPTSPLLKTETLDKAIETFIKSDYDTVISAVNNPHLAWGEKSGEFVPLYEKRLNRQYLPKHLLETGAFVITKREFVKNDSRFGKKINLFEVPVQESVDIDNYSDWIICETQLNRKKIIIRTEGHSEIGLGHIYRSIMLTDSLVEHDVTVVVSKKSQLGLQKLKERNVKHLVIQNEDEFLKILDAEKPDVLINDILDTKIDYMKAVKKRIPRVINFEDLGEGGNLADAVINALYEKGISGPQYYYGEKYYCLRDEFCVTKAKEFSDKVRNVLIVFGGTDSAHYTERMYRVIEALPEDEEVTYQFILGLGFNREKEFENLVNQSPKRINVIKDVKMISSYMSNADIAISSQGRTMYELAVMKVPTIVLAQNSREAKHAFGDMKNGFINLGIGYDVDEEMIRETMLWLMHTPQIRRQMRDNMEKLDLTQGLKRVKRIILGGDLEKDD